MSASILDEYDMWSKKNEPQPAQKKTNKTKTSSHKSSRDDNVDHRSHRDSFSGNVDQNDVDISELINNLHLPGDDKESKKKPSKKTANKTAKKTTKNAPTKVKTTDEDQKKADEVHQALLNTVNRYLQNKRFGPYLKKHGFNPTKDYSKMSTEELESLINRIRWQVGQKTNSNIDEGIMATGMMLEKVIEKRTKFNPSGTTYNLFSNEDFLDDYERFKLEYLSFVNVDYRVRMLFTIGKTAYVQHLINQKNNNNVGQRPHRDSVSGSANNSAGKSNDNSVNNNVNSSVNNNVNSSVNNNADNTRAPVMDIPDFSDDE